MQTFTVIVSVHVFKRGHIEICKKGAAVINFNIRDLLLAGQNVT